MHVTLLITILLALMPVQLHQASLAYLASTEQEAIQVALDINFIGQWSHPNNMCGPLSASILHDAGLISTDPRLFWLLNPREDMSFLEETFQGWTFTQIAEAVQSYDFASNPLSLGSFLYLYAGAGDNFEHMLTVSRVSDGQAYAVTNMLTSTGWTIVEVSLYPYFENLKSGHGGFLVISPTEGSFR